MTKGSAAWLETSDVIPMFPTLVWKAQIAAGLRDKMNPAMMALLADLRHDRPSLAPGQGWQSEQDLHEYAECRDLVGCVEHAMAGILRFLRIANAHLEITACWATVLAKGAQHRLHSHPNNFLSGVYYLNAPPGADAINFHDPRRQASIIRAPVVELTADNTDQIVVRIRSGTLLIFPSYLEHSVDANASGEERVSISFNAMFPSFSKDLSKPLW